MGEVLPYADDGFLEATLKLLPDSICRFGNTASGCCSCMRFDTERRSQPNADIDGFHWRKAGPLEPDIG